MKSIIAAIIGLILGAAGTFVLMIGGAVNVAKNSDLEITLDLTKDDIAKLDHESQMPSGTAVQLTDPDVRAVCQPGSESCTLRLSAMSKQKIEE